MQAHHYPFIDLAVHASVRDRFARGDAVAVLSADLGEVLWANGAAAELFGFDTIYDVLDEGLGGQTATRRQIESALSGLRRTGRPQTFMMRAASGFSRSMAPATLEDIILPDGARALLLISSQAGQILAPGARARQIIAGFEGTGTHVAVLDRDGRVLAASSTFGEIGLAEDEIARMIADVATEDDRLVKRMTEAANGPMPTAIGRLADDPALHLLFAVESAPADTSAETEADASVQTPADEIRETEEDFDAAAETPGTGQPEADDYAPKETADAASAAPDVAEDASAPAVDVPAHEVDADAVEAEGAEPVEAEAPRPWPGGYDTSRIRDELNARLEKARLEQSEESADVPLPFAEARGFVADVPAEDDTAEDDDVAEKDTAEPEAQQDDLGDAVPAGSDAGEPETSETEEDHPIETLAAGEQPADRHSAEEPAAGDQDDESGSSEDQASVAPAAPAFRFDPNGKPARFVWKINRDGEFSEISPEFAAAVGPQSADIVGRSFPDLARVFNLDPDHVIADLLSRRDTWSGKTVHWPIQGTDLVTPVDLAALPTYTRDRQFDGFRGFGIVRIGEARRDPEALGLALVPGAPQRIAMDAAPSVDHGEAASAETGGGAPEQEDETTLEWRDLERDIEDLARMDGRETEGGPDDQDTDMSGGEPGPEDPFRGERPAIHLVETPMRRDSDKVIDLEARRTRPRESLSPLEQAAFREIGARLSESTARDAAGEGQSEADAQSAPPEHQLGFGKRPPAPERPDRDQPETRDIEVRFDEDPAAEEAEAAETEVDIESETATGAYQTQAAASAGEAPASVEPQTPAPEPLPSAFALPARQVMPTGMDCDLIDAIPAPLLVHSGDALIHANAEFFELTGYGSLDELAALGGLDHLLDRPSADGSESEGGMLVRLAGGGARKVTARLRSVNWRDGQALLLALSPIEIPAAPIRESLASQAAAGAEPEASAPETAANDQASALRIEAQELRSILETATDGVVILDNDGVIRSMNGSARALFNYDENDTQGQPFAMLFAHESQRAVMDYVSGLAEHGVSSVLNDGREVIGREAAGGFLPLFMTIGRLSGSNGYCAVLRDITQWKRTEEELRNAKRAAETASSHKSDFLARVSHEIRTPLNAIIGFSEMMVEERFGPIGSPRYLEYAHDIGNSGKHVLDIVNDLLDISKIEAGQVEMEFVAVSLNDHLAQSVSLLQPMANSQRVIIRTSLSASVPEVVADQRSIKQIALNLLSNAIRYTPSGGQIVVSTSYEPSGNVVIRIRDTGIGMNRKELEQAMKPFGQVGPGPRQRGDGTGLGLPLTKAMVEANRAQFDIVSAPGEGTLVTIAFPPQRVLAD